MGTRECKKSILHEFLHLACCTHDLRQRLMVPSCVAWECTHNTKWHLVAQGHTLPRCTTPTHPHQPKVWERVCVVCYVSGAWCKHGILIAPSWGARTRFRPRFGLSVHFEWLVCVSVIEFWLTV